MKVSPLNISAKLFVCVSVDSITVAGQDQGLAYSFGYIKLNASGFYITAGTPTEIRSYICQGESFLFMF